MGSSQSTFLILKALTLLHILGRQSSLSNDATESSAVPALMATSVALAWQLKDFNFYYFSHTLEGGKPLVAWIREY